MSERDGRDDYPIIAATLVGFLVIFGMIGYYLGIHKGQANRGEVYVQIHHEDAKRRIDQVCVSRTGSDLVNCIYEAINTSGEYQRAEYDLTAQQEMSVWAWWLLIISLVAMAITLLGVVYVWKTLVATREGVAETRRIGEAQVRAYFRSNSVVFRWNKRDNASIPDIGFTPLISWENCGHSPAKQIWMFCDFELLPLDAEDTLIEKFCDLTDVDDNLGSMMPPGDVAHVEFRSVIALVSAALYAQRLKLILYSAIIYTDVFDVTHICETCSAAVFPTIDEADKEIRFRTYPHHNGFRQINQ